MNYFKEEQRFDNPWLIVLVIAVTGSVITIFLTGFYKQLVRENTWGTDPMTNSQLLIVGTIVIVIMLGINFLFFSSRLLTYVRHDGIYFRYPPLVNKMKTIKLEEIESYEIRKYNPIKEYGGWGIRVGITKRAKRGKAYNVKGNYGIQFILKNGKNLLLGSQKPRDFKRAVDEVVERRKYRKV